MHATWSWLNNSLPSSILGGIVAGITVGVVLYLWTGNRSRKSKLKQVVNLIKQDIDLNLEVLQKIRDSIRHNEAPTYEATHDPLNLSSIIVASSESYLETMSADMAILVTKLYEYAKQFNESYNFIKANRESRDNRQHYHELINELPDLLSLVEATMTSLKGEVEKPSNAPTPPQN